jgi:hypothetical protein
MIESKATAKTIKKETTSTKATAIMKATKKIISLQDNQAGVGKASGNRQD